MQDDFIESFDGRLRDELLNGTLFSILPRARAGLSPRQLDCSTTGPHSKTGWQTPTASTSHRRGIRRYVP